MLLPIYWNQIDPELWFGWFCCSGRIPRLSLNQHSLYIELEWLRNLLPHHSQGSSTERWSRNSLRVVTTRMVYVLRGFLTSPFILNNSVETAAPFNDVVSREINPWKSFDRLRGSNLRPLAPSAGCLTARPPELTNVCVCVCLYVFVCVCVTRDKYVPSIYVAGCSLSCSINNPVVKFLISYFQLGGWYNM